MNLTTSPCDLDRFQDKEDLLTFLDDLDGIELL